MPLEFLSVSTYLAGNKRMILLMSMSMVNQGVKELTAGDYMSVNTYTLPIYL
jgi:hypothetical protein